MVAILAADASKLTKIRDAVEKHIKESERDPIRWFSPDEFLDFLRSLPRPPAETSPASSTGQSPTSKTSASGRKITFKFPDGMTHEEAEELEQEHQKLKADLIKKLKREREQATPPSAEDNKESN